MAESDTPFLLSRESMKNADMALDFKNNNAMVFGEPIILFPLLSAESQISAASFGIHIEISASL